MTVYWKITQITSGNSSAREDDDVERNRKKQQQHETCGMWAELCSLPRVTNTKWILQYCVFFWKIRQTSEMWDGRDISWEWEVKREALQTLAEFIVKYAVVGRKKSKKQEKSPSELECLTEHGNVHFVCDSWQHQRGGEWEWIKSLDVSLTNCRMISSNPRSAQSLTSKNSTSLKKALEKLKAIDGRMMGGWRRRRVDTMKSLCFFIRQSKSHLQFKKLQIYFTFQVELTQWISEHGSVWCDGSETERRRRRHAAEAEKRNFSVTWQDFICEQIWFLSEYLISLCQRFSAK